MCKCGKQHIAMELNTGDLPRLLKQRDALEVLVNTFYGHNVSMQLLEIESKINKIVRG